nr:rab proteins geranylgeranyltransferase component A 1 [Leptinotarsa decemlineata]
MDYEFPKNFDIIIVGTGVIESILSAAASRVGKKVLQIDKNDYYGGQWASFNLDAFTKIGNISGAEENPDETSQKDMLSFGNQMFNIENFKIEWHVPDKLTPISSEDNNEKGSDVELDSSDDWCQENLLKESRKFNLDLSPKLQYARGKFVDLLISSNVARYSEYRSVSRILIWYNGQLEAVPCSRSDVFSNTKVTVVEKRILMKLLTSLNEAEEEVKQYENKTFKDFLSDKGLTPNLIHYVLYAISMSSDETPCYQGVENAKRFLNSIGRFGKTPFLFSMYGSGEITQAFCRLSAVFGGTFALSQPLSGFVTSDNKFKSLVVGTQHIEADYLVMGIEKAPEKFVKSIKKEYISRGVFITDRSIMKSEKEHLTLLFYPPEKNKSTVTLIEMGSLTGTCPKKLFVVHLISKQNTSPEEDFKHVIENLFVFHSQKENLEVDQKPVVLWSSYFSLSDTSNCNLRVGVPENVFLCPGPDLDLDYDMSVDKAKEIFRQIYPDLEFLPRAPDPEEIIIEGEDNTQE